MCSKGPDPRILILPLLYNCNARCIMCDLWSRNGARPWSLHDLKALLQSRPLTHNVEVINITGGEPTLHPEFLAIAQLVVRSLPNLHTISLQTNALKPDRVARQVQHLLATISSIASERRSVHLDVNISLDGPEDVHDAVRGVPGAWRSVMTTASRCRELLANKQDSALMFGCTVLKQNVRHLSAIQRIADEMGIGITYTVPQITDVYMSNVESSDSFSLGPLEKAELTRFLEGLRLQATAHSAMSSRYCEMLIGLLRGQERSLRCPLASHGVFVEPSGDLYPCWASSSLLLGNVFTDDINVILARRFDASYQDRLMERCRSCSTNCYTEIGRKWFARRIVR